jgi:hypothetical protein
MNGWLWIVLVVPVLLSVEKGSPVENPMYQKPLWANEVRILGSNENLSWMAISLLTACCVWNISGGSDGIVPKENGGELQGEAG